MLLITDNFSFNANTISDMTIRVRKVKPEELKTIAAELFKEHADNRSLLTTKKGSADFTEKLGQFCALFSSKLFTIEDYLKVNQNNVIIYGERLKGQKEYSWFIISLPE